jgi:hypothetical protein
MNKKILPILLLSVFSFSGKCQEIILNKGFEDLVLGKTESQLEEIVGFQGKTINPDEYLNTEANGRKKENLPEFKKQFDQCITYKHIMPIPVSRVFLKSGKVIMIEISSFPDFTKPICLDSKTKEGLKFWDPKQTVEKLYGKESRTDISADGTLSFIYFDSKGIGFGLTNNEVRIIYYY